MAICDCQVYEICPSYAPSDATYATAAAAHNEVVKKMESDEKRAALEHSLATAFVELQRERVPQHRQELWFECLRLAAEIERLNNGTTPTTTI